MIRLLGILLGSAIAVGILIVVVGVPEFPDAPRPLADIVPDPVLDTLPDIVPDVQDAIVADATQDETADDMTEDDIAAGPTDDRIAADSIEDAAIGAATHAEVSNADTSVASASRETRWYAFWSPFRSEFAANGFMTQLQRTTGLDYRVVKQKPGVYEVAFAYTDDADAEQKLAQISQATGLDVPEG